MNAPRSLVRNFVDFVSLENPCMMKGQAEEEVEQKKYVDALGEYVPPPRGPALQKAIFAVNKRAETGGLWWTDEEDLARQRGVALDVVKQIGINIIEGKDLVSVALPVYLFEPRSFLERLADGFSFAPNFLNKAAACKDPVERLKYVITFSVAGIHLTATQKKPFNPILGETYQARFDDGTQIFCEQTTHHPPASNFEVVPADKSYRFWGYGIFSAHFRGNNLHGYQKGPYYVDFLDGTRIEIGLPFLIFSGLIWGNRIQDFGGSLTFTDKKNDLACELVFNPEAPGWVASWFTSPKYPTDYFLGEIYRPSASSASQKKVLSKVEGSWLSHIQFDGETYWELEKDLPETPHPVEDPLPSDCRYRPDLRALLSGKPHEAQRLKVLLEEKQRKEARLRKEGAEKRGRKNAH
jgi:hypothetical protein